MAEPRLSPIERSWNPLVLLLRAVMRLVVGDVIPQAKILFPRAPKTIPAHLMMLSTMEYGLSLPPRRNVLIRLMASQTNDCEFCFDLSAYLATRSKYVDDADLQAFASFESSDRFDEADRAMLRYVREINQSEGSSDETFNTLREYFSEKEIVEITWLDAAENYLNLQSRPLGISSQGYCALPESTIKTGN
ncbi:MAG: hypothetical protein R3A47_00645 [Polyangiales bacterium]